MCKVTGCRERHSIHYCRVCEDSDSKHFARKCPQGIFAYHGTTEECSKQINKKGFKPSKDGTLGSGVYFTANINVAWQIAEYRAENRDEGEAKVLKCRIPKSKQITKQALHGKWDGATQRAFKMLNVTPQNVKNIKLIEIIDDSDSD